MTRSDAKIFITQCREILLHYPENHQERVKYEARIEELKKQYPGIEK